MNKNLSLDINSIKLTHTYSDTPLVRGIFEIYTAGGQTVLNNGKRVELNENGSLLVRNPLDKELVTTILNGYFDYNPSTPNKLTWRINLFENLSKKQRETIKNKLFEIIKEKNVNEKKEHDNIVNIEKLSFFLKNALLESLQSIHIGQIKNEADLKYFLYCEIKKSLSESAINKVIVLVEYKICQGNNDIAWFSASNFQKKKELFNKGFRIDKYQGFIKLNLVDAQMVDNKGKRSFLNQKNRTFKVDLALCNIRNGEILSLIELKFKSKLTMREINIDLTKFKIYNSVNSKECVGIAFGYDSKERKTFLKSNNNELANELSKELENVHLIPYQNSLRINSKTRLENFEDKIIKTAKESLFDITAYGSYEYFLESSWQAEFNYRIRKFLPEGFQIRNEYSSADFSGRIDIAILDNENKIRYLIEFKSHGEPVPKELKNKSFMYLGRINLFKKRMKTILRNIGSNNSVKKLVDKSIQYKNEEHLFSLHFIEKIMELKIQYTRLSKLCEEYPLAKGYIFFNDWTSKFNSTDFEKYNLNIKEFNLCFETRKNIIRELLIEGIETPEVPFYYYNLQT